MIQFLFIFLIFFSNHKNSVVNYNHKHFMTAETKQIIKKIKCQAKSSPSEIKLAHQPLFQANLQNVKFFCQQTSANHFQIQPIDNIISKYAQRPIKIEMNAEMVVDALKNRAIKIKNRSRLREFWSNEEQEALFWLVCAYCSMNLIQSIQNMKMSDWQSIVEMVPSTDADSLMLRVCKLKQVKSIVKPWSDQQYQLLEQIVHDIKSSQAIGSQLDYKTWKTVAQQLYKRSQNPSKVYHKPEICRRKWEIIFDENKKRDRWSRDQDYFLMMHMHRTKGRAKWVEISKILKTRTQTSVRYRFNALSKKIMEKFPNLSKLEITQKFLQLSNVKDEDRSSETEHYEKEINKQVVSETADRQSKQQSRTEELLGCSDDQRNMNVSLDHQIWSKMVIPVPAFYLPQQLIQEKAEQSLNIRLRL